MLLRVRNAFRIRVNMSAIGSVIDMALTPFPLTSQGDPRIAPRRTFSPSRREQKPLLPNARAARRKRTRPNWPQQQRRLIQPDLRCSRRLSAPRPFRSLLNERRQGRHSSAQDFTGVLKPSECLHTERKLAELSHAQSQRCQKFLDLFSQLRTKLARGSPGRFTHPRNPSLQRQGAEADPTDLELPVKRVRTAAKLTAVVLPHFELLRPLLPDFQRSTSHRLASLLILVARRFLALSSKIACSLSSNIPVPKDPGR